MIREFFISKKEGAIVSLRALTDNLNELPDGRYLVRIEKKGRRTLQQNRYYFGCVVPMIQEGLKHLGHDVSMEETHDFLKSKFNLLEIVNTDTGEFISVPKSTKGLSTIEFGEYVAKIQQWAAEFLNINIEDPNTQLTIV